jgi:hypothetical protein
MRALYFRITPARPAPTMYRLIHALSSSWPGLVAAIHVLHVEERNVDAWDEL